VNSSLKFLRKTPWARAKVESLYLHSAAHPRKTPRVVTGDVGPDASPAEYGRAAIRRALTSSPAGPPSYACSPNNKGRPFQGALCCCSPQQQRLTSLPPAAGSRWPSCAHERRPSRH
jgi:hypothetical protein